MNSETRICQNCKSQFAIEPEDFDFYKKIEVPPPTFCPECRAQRRMTFWNEHNLYRKKEIINHKEVFSTYPDYSPIKIYDHDYWWSDAWNSMDYGRVYDFSKPFFAQLQELLHDVPRSSREIKTLIRSDYCDNSNDLKDCYLCFDASYCNNCLYGVQCSYSRDSVDVTFARKMELCYEVFSVDTCFRTFFSVESDNCRDSWFLRDCENCDHCFGCVNLRHKKFHIFNVSYSQEEYEKKLTEFDLGSYHSLTNIKNQVHAFWRKYPYKFTHGVKNTNVIGDYIYRSRDVYRSYEIDDGVNIRYSQRQVGNTSEVYDSTSWGDGSQLLYETVVCGEKCMGLKFSMFCWPANQDLEYCVSCHSSHNLFACVGLRNKSFCIFNKQYDESEYHRLRKKIIEHMNEMPYRDKQGITYTYGEFPPAEISPLSYNESVAIDYFPLSPEEAIAKGFSWRVPEPKEYHITLPADELPDNISDTSPSVTNEILGCLNCKRAYRVIPSELQFYQNIGVSLPRFCPNCRYKERLSLRNPLRWHERACQCGGVKSENGSYSNVSSHQHDLRHCPNKFQTSYAPDRLEIIYCEQCYQAEVV